MQKTLFENTIEKMDRVLKNLDVKYLIIMPDGKRFGNMDEIPTKKRTFKYKWGELKNHVHPYLFDLTVGKETIIPYGKFEKERLTGAICGFASESWGNGSYTYKCQKNGVQILRLL